MWRLTQVCGGESLFIRCVRERKKIIKKSMRTFGGEFYNAKGTHFICMLCFHTYQLPEWITIKLDRA